MISQDCDVVNHDLGKEPVVELLLVTEIQKEDSCFTYGKNPRRLHLQLRINGKNKIIDCVIHNKYFFPREHLITIVPSNNVYVDGENLSILVKWLTNRYVRAAFPDAFNQRVKNLVGNVKSILKNYGGKTYGLFVRLHTYSELNVSEKYKLFLYILYHPKYNDTSFIDDLDICLNEILEQFSKIENIEVIQNGRLSIDDISHYEYLQLKKWDFDSISNSVNTDGETLPA